MKRKSATGTVFDIKIKRVILWHVIAALLTLGVSAVIICLFPQRSIVPFDFLKGAQPMPGYYSGEDYREPLQTDNGVSYARFLGRYILKSDYDAVNAKAKAELPTKGLRLTNSYSRFAMYEKRLIPPNTSSFVTIFKDRTFLPVRNDLFASPELVDKPGWISVSVDHWCPVTPIEAFAIQCRGLIYQLWRI